MNPGQDTQAIFKLFTATKATLDDDGDVSILMHVTTDWGRSLKIFTIPAFFRIRQA